MATMGGAARRLLRPLTDRTVGSLCAVSPGGSGFVMTYDDGPEPGSTDAVLAALAERGATATFFILVGRAEAEPALLREVMAAGHEIALHGLDHRPLVSFAPAEAARRTREGRERLEQLTGTALRWYRPPYGHQTLASWRAVRSAGLEPVLWGPTLQDWVDVPGEERLESALTGAGPGVVVLAHDGYADHRDGVDDGPRPEFDRGELTRRVLEVYADRGLTATSLGTALADGTPVRRTWFRQAG